MSRLLIVEDSFELACLYEEVFSEDGHEVRLVMDGREAQRVFLEWTPDLIVLDIMIPEIDGVALTSILRAIHPTIPIIVHSSFISCQREAYEAGANAFVLKSGVLTELRNAILRGLFGSRVRRCLT